MTTRRFSADDSDVNDLLADLAANDLQPLWLQAGLLTPEPVVRTQPHRWRAKEMRDLGERAGELVPIDRGGDRRVLACANPGLGGAPYATSTMWAAVQYLGPHELAPAHRHTPAALRFVLEGEGVWTLVDGDPLHMSRGDLILTPSWTFHEHHNTGSTPMMWMDVLDLPVVEFLDAVFFEQGPSEDVDRRVDPSSLSERRWGTGPGLVPAGRDTPRPTDNHSPLLAYRWEHTDAALKRMAGVRGADDVQLRFTDPVRGSDVMPTLRCEMRRVAAGVTTEKHRQTGSRVATVLNGAGRVTVGDLEFHIGPGDIVAVPSWAWLTISADSPDEDLDLFTVSDAPVLQAVRVFREEWS